MNRRLARNGVVECKGERPGTRRPERLRYVRAGRPNGSGEVPDVSENCEANYFRAADEWPRVFSHCLFICKAFDSGVNLAACHTRSAGEDLEF
jgi:hypothetical protein